MIDPLSVTGGIGFSIGLLGFLSSGIENAYIRQKDLRECDRRLRDYRLKLLVYENRLLKWIVGWNGRPEEQRISDKDRQILWTKPGYVDIRDRLQNILQIMRQINEILNGERDKVRHSVDQSEEMEWSLFLTELNSYLDAARDASIQRRTQCNSRIGLTRRLKFALYKNKVLSNAIQCLSDALSDLEEMSDSYYKGSLLEPPKEIPQYVQLQKNAEDHTLSRNLALFVEELHAATMENWQQTTEWALELRYPSERESLIVAPEANIDFTIRHRPRSLGGQPLISPQEDYVWTRVRVFYRHARHYRCDRSGRDVAKRIEKSLECKISDDADFEFRQPSLSKHLGTLRDLLESDRSLGILRDTRLTVEQSASRKGALQSLGFPESERLSLACGLVHWSFVLWGSPWATSLCSCSIHRASLIDRQHHYTLDVRHCQHENGISRRHDTVENMASLGTVLTEIVLLQSLMAKRCESGFIFTSATGARFNKATALARIGELSNTYKDAVEFCLNFSPRCESRDLRPEDLRVIEAKIVKP